MNSINKILKLNLKLINAKDSLISNADMFGSIFLDRSHPKTPYKDAHAQSL